MGEEGKDRRQVAILRCRETGEDIPCSKEDLEKARREKRCPFNICRQGINCGSGLELKALCKKGGKTVYKMADTTYSIPTPEEAAGALKKKKA